MKRSANYNTRQREALIRYIISHRDSHLTAAQIVEHFENEDVAIGRTTIFRHLEKLTASGVIRRYTTDGISGACYQYVESFDDCHAHLHLKCEDCGELQHLECDALDEMQHHFLKQHDFEVNALKTVFYGKCGSCLHRA